MNFLPYVESVKTNTQQPELNTTAQSGTCLGTAGIGVDTPDTNLSVTPIIPATPRTGPGPGEHNKHPNPTTTITNKNNRTKKPKKNTRNTPANPTDKDPIETYSVTQINLKRKFNAWKTLLINTHGRKNPIILATEPYSNNNNQLPRINKDLDQYYYKVGDKRPRAAIILHKNLTCKSWEMKQFTTPDQVAVKIKLNSTELILASSYMDINGPAPPVETTPLARYATNNNLPLIMGSDTNSHHTLWGNRACNERGRDLLDFMSSLGLSWANKGSTPTFLNTRGHNSVIDLTITNTTGGDLISNWHVSDLYSNSDHRYIMFDITTGRKKEPRQIRLVKNTDWAKFDEILKNDPNLQNTDLASTDEIDHKVNYINTALQKAFEEACPITYIASTIRKPPWLTPQIEEAQRGIRHKLKRARNKKSQTHWQALREANKMYNQTIRKAQRDAWRTFCKETESVKESARMSKILKSGSSHTEKLEAVYKPDGTLTQNAEETLQVMATVHFKENSEHSPPTISNPHPINNDLLNKIYSSDRLEKAIGTFEPHKAAGPDTLQPIIIQKAWSHIKEITRTIMIKNHENQYIPDPWRSSLGIFLPKPGKTDYNQPKSYRTITLSPVMLKLQEKIILWHMQNDLNMAQDTSKRQYGFKKGCSTQAALHKVTHLIERRIAKKGYVLGVFLDIEAAFDNVSFKAIAAAIRKTKLDPATSQWIINMVTNRYITINHKDATKTIRIKRGCPQGGILSPFLWNLVVDDLLSYSPKDTPGYLQAFADDIVSLAEGNDLDVIWDRTRKTINTIMNWCQTKDLSISALKTKIVMFTWNKKWSLRPIVVGNTTIGLSTSAKFLGVTLDSKLNFNEHITNITNKATASLMQCRRAVGPTWGLTPKTCSWIYKAIIRPILTYSCSVWIRSTLTNMNATKLRRVQALALRIMTGAMPSTPFISLNQLTNTTDIIYHLQGESAKGSERLRAYGNLSRERLPPIKGTIKAHTTINNEFMAELDIPSNAERDLTVPTLNLEQNFTTTTPGDHSNPYREQLQNTIDSTPSDSITCYTDGSKTDEGCGAGFIITTNNNDTTLHEGSYRLPDYCTVFQAELTAITEACTHLTSNNNKHIIIWTDSLSSIQAITTLNIRSRTVIECLNALNHLGTTNTLELRWIAAHTGIWGNEKADELAKLGTTTSPPLTRPIPQSHINDYINNKVTKLNQDHWNNNAPRHTKMTLGRNPTKIINNLNTSLISNRKDYRTAIQLITGHCGLNKHLNSMNKTDTKECLLCGHQEETVSHFLGQCPAIAQLRGRYFNDYYLSINDIFDNFHISSIISFTNKTNRFLEPEDLDNSGVT